MQDTTNYSYDEDGDRNITIIKKPVQESSIDKYLNFGKNLDNYKIFPGESPEHSYPTESLESPNSSSEKVQNVQLGSSIPENTGQLHLDSRMGNKFEELDEYAVFMHVYGHLFDKNEKIIGLDNLDSENQDDNPNYKQFKTFQITAKQVQDSPRDKLEKAQNNSFIPENTGQIPDETPQVETYLKKLDEIIECFETGKDFCKKFTAKPKTLNCNQNNLEVTNHHADEQSLTTQRVTENDERNEEELEMTDYHADGQGVPAQIVTENDEINEEELKVADHQTDHHADGQVHTAQRVTENDKEKKRQSKKKNFPGYILNQVRKESLKASPKEKFKRFLTIYNQDWKNWNNIQEYLESKPKLGLKLVKSTIEFLGSMERVQTWLNKSRIKRERKTYLMENIKHFDTKFKELQVILQNKIEGNCFQDRIDILWKDSLDSLLLV